MDNYLAVFDFDSTLINQEIIDELANRAGKGAEVAAITKAAMAGSIPYEESLKRRVEALTGLTEGDLQVVADAVTFRPGFLPLMAHLKRRGFKIAVISGTFACMIDRLAHRDQFDAIRVNDLLMADGKLTGDVEVNVTDNKGVMLQSLQQRFGVSMARTLAVGDGATDVPMFKRSGFSIALHAKPAVKAHASLALDTNDLADLVPAIEAHFFHSLGPA
ncbi:phosphoserine phosphatase SerB [Candidatus Micrarchaeota archaeon]|nr:phosphoserine phosphatase SerB [Candidatus Micrarchaeota archaeon]